MSGVLKHLRCVFSTRLVTQLRESAGNVIRKSNTVPTSLVIKKDTKGHITSATGFMSLHKNDVHYSEPLIIAYRQLFGDAEALAKCPIALKQSKLKIDLPNSGMVSPTHGHNKKRLIKAMIPLTTRVVSTYYPRSAKCLLRPGDVLFYDESAVFTVPPNDTCALRLTFYLTFREDTPEAQFDALVSRYWMHDEDECDVRRS